MYEKIFFIIFSGLPGVNCKTTEVASMLVTARRNGDVGSTGSTPDWIVAVLAGPDPTDVLAETSNL